MRGGETWEGGEQAGPAGVRTPRASSASAMAARVFGSQVLTLAASPLACGGTKARPPLVRQIL